MSIFVKVLGIFKGVSQILFVCFAFLVHSQNHIPNIDDSTIYLKNQHWWLDDIASLLNPVFECVSTVCFHNVFPSSKHHWIIDDSMMKQWFLIVDVLKNRWQFSDLRLVSQWRSLIYLKINSSIEKYENLLPFPQLCRAFVSMKNPHRTIKAKSGKKMPCKK